MEWSVRGTSRAGVAEDTVTPLSVLLTRHMGIPTGWECRLHGAMSHRIYSLVTDGLQDSEVFKPSEATLLSTVLPSPVLSYPPLPSSIIPSLSSLLIPHGRTRDQRTCHLLLDTNSCPAEL